ncbi:hypothetical protein KCU95_g13, partial [Aureobasidium melanogenum]
MDDLSIFKPSTILLFRLSFRKRRPGHISTNQSRRAEIKHHSSYRIEKKGDRDSRRREKSLDIGIFDEETENRMLTRQPEHYSHRTRFRTSLKHRRVSTA